NILEALKSAGPSQTRGRGAARFRKLLVGVELAISLVLLIGAGLLARSFQNLMRVDFGFRTDHLLTFRVNPIGPLDRDYSKFYAEVLDGIRSLPMAQSAALLSDLPLSADDFYQSGRIRVPGRTPVPFPARPIVNNTAVSPDFFRTLGVQLRSGRTFDSSDRP